MANRNYNLNNAKRAKKDEFYTRIQDIEDEMSYYKQYFKNKVVYCNCDDPVESKFYQHFMLKFDEYKLKRLVTTCYKSKDSTLFSDNSAIQSVGRIFDGEREREITLRGDGDFRSEECIEYLKQADVVVTNPPFSLFREYLTQLIQHEKKFIVLGNLNAFKYKEIFPFFQQGKCWYGNKTNGSVKFNVPEHYPLTGSQAGIDKDGKRYVTVPGVCWYTNLDHQKRHDYLTLLETYSPSAYPKYDNYDAIDVSKTLNIPKDYDGIMGVPISFMDKYNPDQFEIIGIDRYTYEPIRTKVYSREEIRKYGNLNGQSILKMPDGTMKQMYTRIFIRRKP